MKKSTQFFYLLLPYLTTKPFNFFWRLNLFSQNFSATKYVRWRSQKISFFLFKRLIDFLSCRQTFCDVFKAFLYLHNFPFSILPRRKKSFWCRLISCYASLTRLIWDWKFNLLISSRLSLSQRQKWRCNVIFLGT